MTGKQMALLVVILNLIIFGIAEIIGLSYPVLTSTTICIHLGFALNIILLVVLVVNKPRA